MSKARVSQSSRNGESPLPYGRGSVKKGSVKKGSVKKGSVQKVDAAQVCLSQLLLQLAEGFNRQTWHGPNLRGAIRRVPAETAAWRPGPQRRSIADITVHCAYWKYAVRRRLVGEKRGTFPLKGSNWFALEQPLRESTWRECVQLLDEMHAQLVAAVEQLDAGRLDLVPKGSKTSVARAVWGIAAHDVYHAGQIQTLKRLHADAAQN